MIGQSQVTEPLMTALRTDRVNHAYLFSGPRGCGKTTSARILARCLNCAEGPTDTPCGKCPSCIELGRGGQGSLDVVEIDAASHNGVDDARDIRERAIFAPARDRYKIFILDEAHMVTPQGFNALLKIVEEPPEHVMFIFATTEPEKVIGTIRSRTHHYPFRLVPPALMLDYVQKLTEEEGMRVAPGVLPLVVRAGGGSPRDTLSLLDQLIAGSEGDEISYERAVALLGYTHSALLDDVVEALAARDASSAFEQVDRVIQTGQDPRRFVEDLLERLRDLIIIAAAGPERAATVLRGTPADELERMGLEARSFGAAELSRIADIVNDALTEMSGATSPRLHLELMIARALVPSADEAGSLARVERLERRVGVTDASPAAASPRSAAPAPLAEEARSGVSKPAVPRTPSAEEAPSAVSKPAVPATPSAEEARSARTPSAEEARSAVSKPPATAGWATPGVTGYDDEPAPGASVPAQQGSKPAQPAAPASPQPVGPLTVQQIKDSWPQILDTVKSVKMTAWMVVVTATVRKFENDVLTLTFPSENDIASFRPQPGATQNVSDVLREAIQKVLGVRVKFVAKTAADFAQSLKGEGFGVTPPARPAAAEAPQAMPAAPTAPRSPADDERPTVGSGSGARPNASGPTPASQAPVREGQGESHPSSASVAAVPAPKSGAPSTPVTSWAVAAIPGSGGAAAAAKPEVEPEPAPRPKLQAVPRLVEAEAAPARVEGEAAPVAAAATDDDGWSTVAPADDEYVPGDDDAPSFEDDPDAVPAAPAGRIAPPAAPPAPAGRVAPQQPTPAGRVAPQARIETGTPAKSPAPEASVDNRPAPRRGPTFSSEQPKRYGEAVVREILNARFIEEQQLPESGGR